MVPKLLVATFSADDKAFIEQAINAGVDVRVLNCFEETQAKLRAWYPNHCLNVPAHRSTVKEAVQLSGFDVAVIRATADDFVKSALLTQTLREARVNWVLVIAADPTRVSLYRRCGAHHVILESGAAEIWQEIAPFLSMHVTAS
jgi:hypothetical protein